MEETQERVFKPRLPFPGLDLLSLLLYPEDPERRQAWRGCALLGFVSNMEALGSFASLDHLRGGSPRDFWQLTQPPKRIIEHGIVRWQRALRVAEVLLFYLWAQSQDPKLKKLTLWRHWIADRDSFSVKRFEGYFGDHKHSSHLMAAVLTTEPSDEDLAELRKSAGLTESPKESSGSNGPSVNFWKRILVASHRLDAMTTTLLLSGLFLRVSWLERVYRGAEHYRRLGEAAKILKRNRTWKIPEAEPLGLELEAPPDKAIGWIQKQFFGLHS